MFPASRELEEFAIKAMDAQVESSVTSKGEIEGIHD
jgi:hypothetical protein